MFINRPSNGSLVNTVVASHFTVTNIHEDQFTLCFWWCLTCPVFHSKIWTVFIKEFGKIRYFTTNKWKKGWDFSVLSLLQVQTLSCFGKGVLCTSLWDKIICSQGVKGHTILPPDWLVLVETKLFVYKYVC